MSEKIRPPCICGFWTVDDAGNQRCHLKESEQIKNRERAPDPRATCPTPDLCMEDDPEQLEAEIRRRETR